MMRPVRHVLRRAATFFSRADGVSSIEFAIMAPIILLIVAGTLDMGRALNARFQLDAALSAGANYTMLNSDNVTAAKGPTLAASLVTITSQGFGSAQGDVTVTVNNGTSIAYANGAAQASGTASNADLCYCPTRTGSTFVWGSSVSCSTTCPAGGVAGKYVTINASRPFVPLFGGYGIAVDGAISSGAVIQAK